MAYIHKVVGYFLLVVALIIAIIALKGCAMELSFWTIIIAIFSSVLLSILGTESVNRGKRLLVREKLFSQKTDNRPIVLYLRSFDTDRVTTEVIDIGNPMVLNQNYRSEEEQLALVLNEVGRFQAIGRPGEHLPTLGADKEYVSDFEWMEIVKNKILSARLIVIRIGLSAGVLWEVANVFNLADPTNVVLLIPIEEKLYLEFKEAVFDELGRVLPELNDRGFWPPDTGSLRGLIYFQDGWEAHYLDLPPKKYLNNSLYSSYKPAFATVFKELGKSPLGSEPTLKT